MKTIGNFSYLSQIRSANRQIGNHWFDPDTLRFFKGKVYEGVYGGCVFVSSEKNDSPYSYPSPRKYSVRVAMEDGSIQSYAFAMYDSKREADREAKWLGNALKNGAMRWCNDSCEFVGGQAELSLDSEE
jgi:hypothetical protein